MEVKIVISDSPGSTGVQSGSSTPTSGGATDVGPAVGGPGMLSSAQGGTATLELLSQAAATGAIDAGPAPDFSGVGQAGVPPPFIGGRSAAMVATSTGSTADEPAGAAPGSEARMATYTVRASEGGV
jgi:hypothetical protein